MEEQDLFPEISGFQIPKEAESVLRSQNVNLTQYQKEINNDISAGGDRKNRRIQHTFQLLDKVLGTTYYGERLSASLPATQKEVVESFGNTTGKQNFLGNFWNNSAPALVEGVGKLGAILPAIFETDDQDWNKRNKAVEDFVRPMLTYVDDSFANSTPISWDKEKGEVDFSNLTSGAAWASTVSSLLGFMAPVFATAGVGGIVRGVSGAGKAAEGLTALAEVADVAANGAKLDKIGKAMMGVEFATSTAMMFPEYQKMGIDSGLTIGQATKVALPLAIVNGAIELIGGEAFAKGLGFTTSDASKVIREVTLQNTDNVLAGLRSGAKLDEAMFQDIVERVAKDTINTLSDPSQRPLWKTIVNRAGRAAKAQGIPESFEEGLQSTSEELAKAIYNSTVDPSVPEGKGRFADFSPQEYATNSLFGTFLGGMMGTGMGMLHKNPKVFDQTLFNYVGADVASQIANGAQSFEEIAPNLKAYRLAQKGLEEGHWDEAEAAKIEQKIGNMAQVAFEFAQSKEIGKAERYAMYQLTQTQNGLLDQESEVVGLRQGLAEAQKAIDSGTLSPKALIDANRLVNETGQKLGDYDAQNDVFAIESEIATKKAVTSNLMKEVGKAMADVNLQKIAPRYLMNELSKVNGETMSDVNYVSEQGLLIIRQADGKSSRLLGGEIRPVPTAALSEDLAFTQDSYQPKERAQIVPKPYFESFAEYQEAERIYSAGKKIGDIASLTTSPVADASEVIALGQQMVQSWKQMLMPESETPIVETLMPLYDYYKQIEDYDAEGKYGVAKYETPEAFFAKLGVPTESDALDAAEGVPVETSATTQPESLASLPEVELQVQTEQTNEGYDESLVDAQIQAFVEANGITPEVSIPIWVDVAIRRAEMALPMSITSINEAADYLYKLYGQWKNMKKASSRMYTIAQIDEMLEAIGADIELLIQYRNAYEEGTESEFRGRDQAAEASSNPETALSNAQSQTPVAEPANPNSPIEDGNTQIDKQTDQGTRQSASDIQSEFAQEQQRTETILDAGANLEDAASLTAQLETLDANDARVEQQLEASIRALEAVSDSLDQVDPDIATQSGNQDSGTNGNTETQIDQLTSRQVRKKLDELRRVPQSFREAVLWYFADGGKVRREDIVRFLGEGAISGGKGSNAYLSYIADTAQPYDSVLRAITESMGYQSVEELGDETSLTDAMFEEIASFYGTSPNRLLLGVLLAEQAQEYEPLFGEVLPADELVAHFAVDESTLDALLPEDIETFEAFLRTLPNNIDPTNPEQVFAAFLEYSKDGFPPMSESAMRLIDAVAAAGIDANPALPKEYKDLFQPLIEKYNESVRQNDPVTETASPNGSVESSGASASPPAETRSRPEKPKSRRTKLDNKAKKLREALAADWDAFLSPGDSASSSVIGITPQQFAAASRMIVNLAELGINRFEDAMLEIIDIVGLDKAENGFKAFKAAYFSVKANDDNTDEDLNALRKVTFENIKDLYVSSTSLPLESDSPRGGIGQPMGPENVQPSSAGVLGGAGNGGDIVGESGDTFTSDSSIPLGTTVAIGNEGDPDLHSSQRNDVTASSTPGLGDNSRGSGYDENRLSTEREGVSAPVQSTSEGDGKTAKQRQQLAAEPIPVVNSNLDNIVETLPYLLPHQQTNVLKAETRLLDKDEKGILFTDGTGTGKTLTALGIAKRFLKRGAKNILIVTPSDKKIKDWIDEASILGIRASGLKRLDDKGEGVSVTTYANFGKNKEISKRTFDLIIYDESHNIMSNEQGSSTLAFNKHLQLSKPAYTAYQTAYDEYREALNQAGLKASKAQEAGNEAERLKWRAVYEEIREKKIPDRTKELIAETKVVFLSATPFPYHKSIQYADGFLFKAGQNLDSKYRPIEKSEGYNSGNEFEKYMMSAFGYRMRYNRLTTPESGVDVGLMERNWIEGLKQSGAVSGTKLEIPQDYSREFVLLTEEKEVLAIGSMIDEGLKIIHDNQEYRELSTVVHSKMDYLYKNRLLEQIKAKLGIDRIRKHIEAGRKVVVFHSYNEGVASHPFDFSFLGDPEFKEKFESITAKAAQQAADFTRKYPEYSKLDLSGLRSVPAAISKAFGGSAVMFNGNVPNEKRLDNVKAFNDNGSEVSIIVVNIAAGEAGLNLHDTTGQHQRVVVQLGLPIRPTSAIQSEGRIYRTGQKTNAIFEYFVTHLNFEKYAFGSKINERSGTAENLAMGNEARDLKVSFKEGYLNPVSEDPSENQGTGGKQMDYSRAAMTPFQKAITYYYARAKKTSKNKSAEGVDYFATPEPLGMKMVEWLYAQPNDKLLEPSAGHGAIARFFPDNTDNVMIEPSTELRSDLAVSAHGTAVGATFEQLSIVNKFDGITMNPPFGTGAKTAMEHLQKAIKHLNDKGRIVALVPVGQMDKRLEKYLYGLNEKGKLENPEAEFIHLTARIALPSVTFERAGTNVATQILIFDKEVSEAERVKLPATRYIDLRMNISNNSVVDITELFQVIENLEMPARNRNGSNQAPVVVAAQPSRANNQIDSVNVPVKGFHAKNQKDIFVVQTSGKLSDQEYTRIKSISSKHNGYYSSFRGNGATPGFQFQTLQDANAFYKEVTGKEAPQAQMMFAGQNIADTDIQQSLLSAQESYAANGLDKKTFDEIRSNMDDFVNWERVRIATGWFKGVDNQWQYEFSDADAQLLVSIEEIQAEVADEGAVAYKLIDILKHNKLYNYYPQTEDIEVFFIDENSRTLGQFDPITKELTINLNQYNERESSPLYNVRSVILHELQHYIQSNEGLEYGSSSVDAEKWLQSEAGRNSGYYSEYARIEQDISRLRLLGSIDANGNPLTDDAKRTLQSKERIVDKVYRANAGEVAARNTQARVNMNELERRASAPIFSTLRGEGVPASEVWTNNVQNTINLLGQRFGGVRFETPATEAAYMQMQQGVSSTSEAAYGFWDPVQRRIVLNPKGPGVNTAIHEIAHPWVSWAKQSNPEMYQRGIDLVRDSFYTRELLRDPNYQGLSIGEIYEEALVRAIADQGEKFITPIRTKGFLEWFRELFDSIAQFLGIRNATPEQLATMSLEEFAKAAAADILAGDTQIFKDTTGNLTDDAVNKTLFSFARNSYDFSQNQPANVANYASWQDHVDYAFSMIPIDILTKRPAEITSKDRKVLDVIFAKTGLRYKGAGDWDFDMSKSPDTAFLGDGSLVRMDRFGQASNQKGLIATTYRNGFLKLYNQEGIKGDIFRFVVNNLRGLFNIETMASLLDDGSGIITSLINDVKRAGGRNKAYVTNILNPKRWKIAQLAKDFTIYEGVNTIWTAKRVEIETYGWDEKAQDVVTRRVEVPLATAMSLVLTADTQDSMGAQYGGNSVTIPDRFIDTNGNLIDIAQYNPNATPAEIAAMKKAIIFSQAKNVHRGAKLRHSVLEKKEGNYEEVKNISLLLSNRELEKLRNRFANGNGITSDAETEVFSLLKDAFNDKVVRDMIKNEDEEYLNFGEDFVVVTDYFPINSADGQTQVDDRLKYRPALEDAKLLNERAAAPKSVWVGDALDMLEDYEYRVGNILEHGRLSHNITTIANALRTEIPDDPLVSQMTQWLLDRRELIEDWRGYKAARQDKHKWAKPINLILSRYTSSIFRLNFGMATKQLATYYSAAGQSMLKDEYLFKAEGYKNLLSLSRGMVTDTISGVGAEIVEGTDVGFVDALGGKSTQADIIRELLGENIEDPAEKETHRRRYATVIERVLYAQNAYVGGVDFDKVTFNQKGLGLMQKLFGRADSWMENIGMAPMRISDRAVILSYYLAAKEQVSDEIAAGTTENANFDERVAEILESALYATNQMNKVADMTTMQTSTNWLTKLLGLYSGQTQKLLNVFVQAFVNSLHNPDSEEAKTRLRKAFISNAIVVPLYLASVTTIWSVLKAIANGDEPKDYSYYQEQYFWNVVKNMGSIVPGLSEQVATTIISKIDNEPWSDSLLDYPGDEIVNSTIESFIDLYNWGAAEDQLEAGKYADSFYYNIEKSFSGWTGTPKVVTRFVREHTTTDQDDQ